MGSGAKDAREDSGNAEDLGRLGKSNGVVDAADCERRDSVSDIQGGAIEGLHAEGHLGLKVEVRSST